MGSLLCNSYQLLQLNTANVISTISCGNNRYIIGLQRNDQYTVIMVVLQQYTSGGSFNNTGLGCLFHGDSITKYVDLILGLTH